MDGYEMPSRRPCPRGQLGLAPQLTEAEVADHRRDAVRRHGRAGHNVPNGFNVTLEPNELTLKPGAERDIQATITVPDGFNGRRGFNLDAFAGGNLYGGVTLYIQRVAQTSTRSRKGGG